MVWGKVRVELEIHSIGTGIPCIPSSVYHPVYTPSCPRRIQR
jgi:hypothetical protein